MKTNIVFLSSGGGGNLKFIHQYYRNNDSVKISGVFADRECGALEYARSVDIPSNLLDFERNSKNDQQLLKNIGKAEPDFVITNIHKILSKPIVDAFKGKLINLHYSYLPAYRGLIGMQPVNEALQRNNSFIGCTAHFVDAALDNGETIAQGIFNQRVQEVVSQTTFECGAMTLLSAIEMLKNSGDADPQFVFKDLIVSPGARGIQHEACLEIFKKLKP